MNAPIWKRCSLTSPVNVIDRPTRASLRPRRIMAMVQRHIFLLMGSLPRFFELLYWPTLNMILWGFINFYLSKQHTGAGLVAGVILGAAMLWEILLRSQFGVL